MHAADRNKPYDHRGLAKLAAARSGDLTPKHYGLLVRKYNATKRVEEIAIDVLIPKGRRLPTSTSVRLCTERDGQTAFDCTVAETDTVDDPKRFVRVIWQGELGPLPAGRAAGQPIDVTFSCTAGQVLTCSFKDVESGKRTDINLSMVDAKGGDDFDIEKFTVE